MSGTTTIPNDPNPALRAEYLAALAILGPQIDVLTVLFAIPFSAALHAAIDTQISIRTHRQMLIKAAIASLDAVVVARNTLGADGYPTLPPGPVPASLLTELQQEISDIEAVIAILTVEQAASLTIGLGDPIAKNTSPS